MKWRNILKLIGGCREALPVALENTSTKEPLPDADAILVCKDKVGQGKMPDTCVQEKCPRWKK